MGELKVCPFCGGKAKFNQAFNGCIPGVSKTVFYSCEQCESISSAITGRCENQEELFALAEKAAAAWNRRADDAALAQLARESVKRELKLAKLEAEVARWAQAEADGLLVVLKAAIGDKVHDTLADYDFVVQQADIYKNTIVYRCGNEGTEDYAAFHDSEYGERFTHKAALEGAGG